MSEGVLDVVSEDPEIEHVPGDVGDPAVHEHRDEEGQVDRDGSGPSPGSTNDSPLAGSWTVWGRVTTSFPLTISLGTVENE